MLTNYAKRILSFVLALTMILGMVPVQAFATESDLHEGHDHEIMAEGEGTEEEPSEDHEIVTEEEEPEEVGYTGDAAT